MTYPTISDNRAVQCAYVAMRQAGQSHNMAEMLATRQVPSLRTNTTLLAAHSRHKSRYCWGNDKHTKCVHGAAKQYGLNPDNYVETLARYPGDPQAFLPNDDPQGHIKKVQRSQKRLSEPRGD